MLSPITEHDGRYELSFRIYVDRTAGARVFLYEQNGQTIDRLTNFSSSYKGRWITIQYELDQASNEGTLFVNGNYIRSFNINSNARLSRVSFHTKNDGNRYKFWVDACKVTCIEGSLPKHSINDGKSSTQSRSVNNITNIVDNLQPHSNTETPQLSVYPNPTIGNTTIQVALEQPEEITISVYNKLGQLVKSEPLGEQSNINQTVDLSDLPSGNYWVRVNGKQTNISKQVVKQ